jgi:eukaryotic-like serine/threonine-protein kinase
VLGAAAYGYWQSRQVPFARRDWVLMTDFENATGDSVFDRSLATAVAVSVQQSAHVNVVPASRAREWLPRVGRKETDPITEMVARDLAQRVGARAVVAFAIARLGDVYMLSARIVDPESGATLATESVRANGRDRVLDALDELAREIRGALGESRRSMRETVALPLATTSSLDALKRFAEGQREFDQAHYEQARILWQAAVALDSNFARAHASLGSLYYYGSNDRVNGEKHFARALALRDRLTDRERMWIEAQVATARDNREEAIRLLTAYLDAYPDDEAAWASLGYNNLRLERCQAAIPAFERVLKLDPQDDAAYTNMGTCHVALNDPRRALEAFRKGTAIRPSAIMHPGVNGNFGQALAALGRYAEAESVYRKMLEGEPTQRGRGRRSLALLAMLRGRYDSAAAQLREGVLLMRSGRSPTGELRNRLYLAMAYDRAGRADAMRAQLDSSLALAQRQYLEPTFLALLGQQLARSGDVARASVVLDTVTARANLESKTDRSMLELLRGEVALARGNKAAAVGHLELGFSVDTSSYLLESLANALAEQGDLDRAAARFRAIIERQDRGFEGQEYWVHAHYELGRIYEAKGDAAEAARWYNALLELWKEADPGLPLLREVQERMARLRGERKPTFNMG